MIAFYRAKFAILIALLILLTSLANAKPISRLHRLDIAPTIQGQTTLTTAEDQPITIEFNNLIVEDPDNVYPTGFTMAVQPGTNYSVVDRTVTPAPGFSGNLTVPVVVNDGVDNSNTFNLQITVTSVNTAPTITGQSPITTNQDQPVTIGFGLLTVTDPDNAYPTGFSMLLSPGSNYTFSNQTVTPAAGFSGTLTVPVLVSDGTDNSNTFNVQITVNAVAPANTPPSITGQTALSTQENQPLTIAFANLVVSDPDDTYPTGFTMTLSPGANYSVSNQTVTPAAGFSGALSVPVIVNDGTDNSNAFNLQITVTAAPPTNVAPTITGQSTLTTQEDQAITIEFANLTVNDPDDPYPTGFTMSLSPGTNYTVSNRTVTPTLGFTGTLSVPVVVNDGTDNSNTFSLQITVTPKPVLNTPPTITGQSPLSTQEDQSITVGLQHLTVSDPDDVYPTGFTMTLSSGANYSINDKTITPSPGFTGTLSIPTVVNDGEANSNTFALQITVTPKPVTNVRPTIAGQVPLSMLNDQSLTVTLNNLIVTDPDDAYPTGFTLKVLPGDNYSVSGTTIRPTTGFVGILSVNVLVNDGELDSNPFQLRITVSPANTNVRPIITGQLEVTTFTNTPIALNLSHLLVTDPDDTYPTGFTLTVHPGSNYTVSGTTITPAANFVGTLTVGVTVNDGTTSSEVFNFRVSVIDRGRLQIVGQSPISTMEDSPVTLDLSKLQVNDPDKQYPNGFSIQAQAGDNYSLSGNQVVPNENYFGNLTVPITITNGQRTSDLFSLVISVTPVNDPPVFETFDEGPISYFAGSAPIPIAREISIRDVDNESLVFAEVRIDGENFLSGKEELVAQPAGNIQSVFDPNTGILILIGNGSIAEYESVLQSIQYHFKTDTLPSVTSRLIRFRLNDGLIDSEIKTKTISLEENISLDIPNVFTPNGDDANDTWKISNGQPDNITATVRVFDKKGLIIYESDTLAPWDGRYRGDIVSPDTYFYIIEVNAGVRTISKRGVVTVVR